MMITVSLTNLYRSTRKFTWSEVVFELEDMKDWLKAQGIEHKFGYTDFVAFTVVVPTEEDALALKLRFGL